jgi:hypothetical protein
MLLIINNESINATKVSQILQHIYLTLLTYDGNDDGDRSATGADSWSNG